MSKYLLTGSAGFIGYHLTKALIKGGHEIIGLDNINNYYDPQLKYDRLFNLGVYADNLHWNKYIQSDKFQNYKFIRMNLEDKKQLFQLFENEKFDYIINLAAQAGVRNSIDNPDDYINSNILGFFNILEACRHFPVQRLIYASSSSVYGNNTKIPFSECDNVDHPVSLYAATKKTNELMAFSYSHLYNLKVTGLRFFTVYGPWGRPDMAYYKFTHNIVENLPIDVYAEGKLLRDYTYIDDIIEGILKILDKQFDVNPPELINIGNSNPESTKNLVEYIQQSLQKNAVVNYKPMQSGDVNITFADIKLLNSYCGYSPHTSLKEGIFNFCNWFTEYKLKK